VLQNGVTLGLVAIAEALVILTGDGAIDLSVGSMLSLSGMILGVLAIEHRVPLPIAIGGGVLCGVVLGAINGWLVSVIRIPPLIATLATFYGYAAIALQITHTRPLPDATRPELVAAFSPSLVEIGNGNVQDVPPFGWIPHLAGLGIPFQLGFIYGPITIVVAFVLIRTVAGRYLYAVGTNALAARFAAIDVWGIRFWTYVAAGALCGIAGVVQTALSASATPDAGASLNLAAITIAIFGGIGMAGVVDDIIGVALATAIVVFLDDALGLRLGSGAGVWQPFALGVLLIGSAFISARRCSPN